MTLLIVAAVLLPLLVIATIGRQVLYGGIYNSFRNELNANLESISLILDWIENDLVTEVESIAGDDALENELLRGTVPEIKKRLTSQRKVLDLAFLAAFDLNHALLASSKFKSKNLSLRLEQQSRFQVAESAGQYYLVYVRPITKKTRTLGYLAGGMLLSDETFMQYLHDKHISNTAFWLDEKLLLSDLPAQAHKPAPEVRSHEMFEARFSGHDYRGLMRVRELGEHRLYFAQFISTKRLQNEELQLTITIAVMVAVLFVLCLSLLEIILSRLIKPLHHLTAYARQLSANKFLPRVDFGLAKLAGGRHDEVGKLAEAFMHMERQLRAYLHELTESTRANERIQSELRIARDIQMSMLPHAPPATKEAPEFEIAAVLEPAREVGGDFYDYFMIDECRLCFVIGDVSDKGVPASLFMAVSKSLVRALTNMTRAWTNDGLLPQEVLTRVNHELCRENELLMFVTLFYGMLDTRTGEVIYSSAGHSPPFLLSPQSGVAPLPPLRSTPLGVKHAAQYSTNTVTLRDREMLFLYTDGLTEARDAAGAFYSEKRLEALLRAATHENAGTLSQKALAEVKRFVNEAPASDDMTIMALQFLPRKNANFVIHNRLDELYGLIQALEAYGERHGVTGDDLRCVRLTVEELITNTLKYGYRDDAVHELAVEFARDQETVSVRIEDDAAAFNPWVAEISRGTSPGAGGYGLKMIRELVDEHDYQRRSNKNVLIFKRKLQSRP